MGFQTHFPSLYHPEGKDLKKEKFSNPLKRMQCEIRAASKEVDEMAKCAVMNAFV